MRSVVQFSHVSTYLSIMCNKVLADIQPPHPRGIAKKSVALPRARVELHQDILAIFTIYTKIIINRIAILLQGTKSTTCYRLVTRTTQPAHLAVIVAVLFLGAAIYPATSEKTQAPSVTYQFLYVTATAIHFGSQIWMTFISGLSLYFTLPRHDFGEVQKVLFPIYFVWCAGLSFIALTAQLRISGVTGTSFLLITRLLLEMFVRTRCCDSLLHLITSKNVIEANNGLGREVGKLAADSELFDSDQYLTLHRQFRRLHMIIAMSNMAAIAISTLHLWLSLQNRSIPVCH